MKKLNKILAVVLSIVMIMALLASCGPKIPTNNDNDNPPNNNDNDNPNNNDNPNDNDNPNTPPANETVSDKYPHDGSVSLIMATGYDKPNTGMAFDADTITENDKKDGAEDGAVTLSNGVAYRSGDLKPTWAEMENRLGVKFESVWTGAGSASKEFDYWKDRLGEVTMISGSATGLSAAGVAGQLVNIADYLDMMPNFKAFLDANPIVKMTIIGDTSNGAIYISPYFDGISDIERMPLMRTDWVEKLLNGEGKFTADTADTTATPVYTPFMPTEGTVDIDVVKADGSGVETITKDYSKYGNIVAKMNEAGSMGGVEAVNMLRDYIDATYNGYYGTNRADLFIGQNAAWDVDELVALLRCITANTATVSPNLQSLYEKGEINTNKVYGIFSREDGNTQRRVDMFRFAGTLFGVRGLESRRDYLYVGNDGELHDARMDEATYTALAKMNDMAKEGLIAASFLNKEAEMKTDKELKYDVGFMHYDYNQTQTIYNESQLNGKGATPTDTGEKYMAVMVPVSRWNDGTGEKFMRFTESWRSVKTDAWAISKAGVEGDDNKLYACLNLIDYAYSKKGQILLSYGPDEFIKTNSDGSYVNFSFNGEDWPEISDGCRNDLNNLMGGNYTNFGRRIMGSTMSFLKTQSFEFQCTVEAGREGAGHISTAIGLGTIKHPELALTDNPWYTSVPTLLPLDETQTNIVNGFTDLVNGDSGKFGTSSKSPENILCDIICNGFTTDPNFKDPTSSAAYVADGMSGTQYLGIQNEGWHIATGK